MPIIKQMTSLPPLEKSKPQTKICKLCFKDFEAKSLPYLFNSHLNVCPLCLKDIRARFIRFDVLGYRAISIYNYDSKIQGLLYQLKGCFDIEIAEVFFARFFREISIRYKTYLVVPIPSFDKEDKRREFNHVEEIFKSLKLPMRKLIVKTKAIKQANSSAERRKDISNYLELTETPNLSKTKILLVDDVYTTGSTMKAAVRLIEKLHPKDIKILVMSKTENKASNSNSKYLLFDTFS